MSQYGDTVIGKVKKIIIINPVRAMTEQSLYLVFFYKSLKYHINLRSVFFLATTQPKKKKKRVNVNLSS